jgi:hypothetical protein
MADKAGNRAAALKLYEGKSLDQNEERSLETARNQAGSEGRTLDRIVATGKP